ncbi:hypothetical protein D3C75_765500 [compost metagenome]
MAAGKESKIRIPDIPFYLLILKVIREIKGEGNPQFIQLRKQMSSVAVKPCMNNVKAPDIFSVGFAQHNRIQSGDSAFVAAQKYPLPILQGNTCTSVLTAVVSAM